MKASKRRVTVAGLVLIALPVAGVVWSTRPPPYEPGYFAFPNEIRERLVDLVNGTEPIDEARILAIVDAAVPASERFDPNRTLRIMASGAGDAEDAMVYEYEIRWTDPPDRSYLMIWKDSISRDPPHSEQMWPVDGGPSVSPTAPGVTYPNAVTFDAVWVE